MKYLIIGGRKCGSTSLEVFLNMQGYNVFRREQLFTSDEGFKIWEDSYADYTPVLILRDPIERAYSDWKYAVKDNRTKLSYRDYCDTDNYNPALGELNPIKQSNYKKWFKNWNVKMWVLSLDHMKKLRGFPKLNTTEGEISKGDRKWTEKRINEL